VILERSSELNRQPLVVEFKFPEEESGSNTCEGWNLVDYFREVYKHQSIRSHQSKTGGSSLLFSEFFN